MCKSWYILGMKFGIKETDMRAAKSSHLSWFFFYIYNFDSVYLLFPCWKQKVLIEMVDPIINSIENNP